MAKKTTSRATRAPAPNGRKLEQLDRELVRLLNERAKAYERAEKPKTEPRPMGVSDDDLADALAAHRGPLDPAIVRSILLALHSGCQALIHRTRVAYLGPQYSYSHQAAIEYFGPGHELVPASTIAAVFEEVNRRHVTFGVVPLENSTDGRVSDTLDMFVRLPVRICGEIQLRIHHYLLARCPRGEITEVYSKPQALSQCRDWLAKSLPGVRLVEMASTTAAARLAAEKHGAAAIASRHAGVQYGLSEIEGEIEDNRNNVTRFAVIGQDSPPRTRHDKTSLMFEIPHAPGALADAMGVFKINRLNMTWIESFPMPGSKNEYLFFVEIEGNEHHPKMQKALQTLRRRTERLVVLGSYPRSKPVD